MKKVSLSLIVDGEKRANRNFIEHKKFAYDKIVGMYKQLIGIARGNLYYSRGFEIITNKEEEKVKEA